MTQESSFDFLYNNLKLLSIMCFYCPTNQFKDFSSERCQLCPEGGICINGQLFNKPGEFYYFFLLIELRILEGK